MGEKGGKRGEKKVEFSQQRNLGKPVGIGPPEK